VLETSASNAQIQTSGIFIGYRRADTAIAAATLCARLRQAFANRPVFLDLGIAAGDDYRAAIRKGLSNSRVSLILVGPRWLEAETDRNPRIWDPNDLVRFEVASALELRLRVIPVLVDGAEMPNASQLRMTSKPLPTVRRGRFVRLISTWISRSHRNARRQPASKNKAPSGRDFRRSRNKCARFGAVARTVPETAAPHSGTATERAARCRIECSALGECRHNRNIHVSQGKTLTDDEKHYLAPFGIKGPKRVERKVPVSARSSQPRIQDKINEYLKDQAGASEKALDDADEVDTSFKKLSFSFNLLAIRIEISTMGYGAAHPRSEDRGR